MHHASFITLIIVSCGSGHLHHNCCYAGDALAATTAATMLLFLIGPAEIILQTSTRPRNPDIFEIALYFTRSS